MSRPTVSVPISVTHEEATLRAAIESILEQTYRDFEVVIVDNGSTDSSSEILSTLRDPRLRIVRQARQSPAHALNTALTHCRGDIIALASSREISKPHRLERQLAELEARNIDVLTTWISRACESPTQSPDILYHQPVGDQAALLHWLFYRGASHNETTAMIRRTVLDEVGVYRSTLFTLPHFDLWLRILATRPIDVIPEQLVCRQNEARDSNGVTSRAEVQSIFEYYQVYRRFFETVPRDLFRRAFCRELRNPNFSDDTEYAIEQAFLYLGHPRQLIQGIGVERLAVLLQDRETLDIARSKYDFGLPDVIELSSRVDWTHPRTDETCRAVAPAQTLESAIDSHGNPTCIFSSETVLPETHEQYGQWGYAVPFPSQQLMGTGGASNFENFLVVGDSWFHLVSSALRPGSGQPQTLVDIGCGCGRLARYFLWWPQLHFIGIDLFRSNIEWCEEYLRPLAPRQFRFHFFDGRSAHYNPHGTIDPTSYELPVASQSADIVVAASLFTHLLEDVARHYLAEIARILRPTGRAIVSLLTETSPEQGYSGNEFRADFSPQHFCELAEQAGLQCQEDRGEICGERVIVLHSGQSSARTRH